jgi:hypothetical protein
MRALPKKVELLCKTVEAPPRLIAHLTLVHDVAVQLVEEIKLKYPNLQLHEESIFFGAGTHDIGKSLFHSELSAPGSEHESAGERLLIQLGIDKSLARFTRTHAAWQNDDSLTLEDLLVSLADNCWKGKRLSELENLISERIANQLNEEVWNVYMALDDLLQKISAKADERLMWQAQFNI